MSHHTILLHRGLIRVCKEMLAVWEKWLDAQERRAE